MTSRYALTLPIVLFAALVSGACSSNPVGRECFLGAPPPEPDQQNIVAAPALECESRTCLHMASTSADMCTASCDGDGDCDKVDESPCQQGFACMIPVTVGAFCCRKLCVCKDYLEIPPGGLEPPDVCDASNAANECCNLSGRRGNAAYPGCS
jgi:hypothetical protein